MNNHNIFFSDKRFINNDLSLFQEENISNKKKFYILMDLLVSNQENSSSEFFVFFGIFYAQIISIFFSDNIGILDKDKSFSDNILFHIEKILRIKDLFTDNYTYFKITEIVLFSIFIILLLHFLITCYFITRNSFYSYNISFINTYIKIFLYIGYNIILDLCFSNFCFGPDEFNPNFINVKCPGHGKIEIEMIVISIIFCVMTIITALILVTYYYDSFFLSQSYYAKISCNYDYLLFISCFFNSLLLSQIKFFTKKIFLLYNLVFSVILLFFYINCFVYYNNTTNTFSGMFHFIYLWTSLFGILFGYTNIYEKGVIYILISIIIYFLYLITKKRIIENIIIDTPYHKINNQYYLLYYCHSIVTKIICMEEEPKNQSLLYGIIQMHLIECPNNLCLLKTKDPVYLPISKQWSTRIKESIDDEILLKNFIIVVLNYYLNIKKCILDLYLNLSLYYLKVIGNSCEAIYLYKKISEFQMTYQEEFTYQRLNIKISKALIEKLKPSNEVVSSLEYLDVSQYYKYDFLSQNFIDEISNDVNLSLEFWKIFREPLKDNSKCIDFNKVFDLTDKIRISNNKVEKMWNELLSIYTGVNEYFELYSKYVVEMNDDDLKKRDLDSLKRKSDNYNDHLIKNFNDILFNKDTGIIIVNGEKGSEGTIELSNQEIENIFKYKTNDLKSKNLVCLLPKIFAKEHSKFMQKYFKIGEKKIIDNNNFFSFGKDKNNNIIKVKLMIKLFPILNKNVYFVGLIVKENIDDLIFMDNKFNIQGMSYSLIERFGINSNIFKENEIPFYVICKKFLNFYAMFLDKSKNEENNILNDLNDAKGDGSHTKEPNNLDNKKRGTDNKNIVENLEINENIELEYEIKIPNFLFEYSETLALKNNKFTQSIELKSEEKEKEKYEHYIDEESEEDPLIDDYKYKSKLASKIKSSLLFSSQITFSKGTIAAKTQKDNFQENSPTPTPMSTTTPTPTPTPTPTYNLEENITSKKKNIKTKGKNDEKNKCNKIIEKYTKLFEIGNFLELEDLIDTYNINSKDEYKFNFTFDKYKYGNNQTAYIVRCIDNKNDGRKSEDETINEVDQKGLRYKKEKIESIKPLYELFPKEKNELKDQTDNFIKLSLENYRLQKALQACKEDIKEMSIAYGKKDDIIIKDENSSQIAQSGFDSGLVKKNRIEEIKSNILVNIEKFPTFKYIKIVIFLFVVFTIVFGIIYILLFLQLNDILKDVSLLNIELFQNCLWTTELVSIFISLKTLYENRFNPNFIFKFYKYYETDTNLDYYNRIKETSKLLYFDLLITNEALQKDMSNYLEKKDLMNLFWERLQISYVKNNYSIYYNELDREPFPMAMAQFLSNCISFLTNNNFNIDEETKNNYNSLTEKDKYEIDIYKDHILFIIIENAYDNIIPNHFKKITTIPDYLKKYNENKRIPTFIIIILYSCIMVILCVIYYILLFITNKALTGGLNKVTKIRLEQVEETIKAIESFNSNLKSLKDKTFNSDKEREKNAITSKNNDKGNDISNETENDKKNNTVNSLGFSTESKKIIPLKTITFSFAIIIYIICCLLAFLIPIYIYTNQMVTNTNDLLLVENYIFGTLIKASTQTVEIKCFMSSCKNEKNLDYSRITNTKIMMKIIKGINSFKRVKDFYDNNFLLNACGAAINNDTNPTEYDQCINDNLIISANNTDSLIRLIGDFYDNIKKEYDIQIQKQNNSKIEEIKLSLFNNDYFLSIETLYYKYIHPVGKKFTEVATLDLKIYLNIKRTLIILLLIIFICLIVLFCIFFGIILIKQLIHYLSVSRCIMKIIPTSVIINTQELESWIEKMIVKI